MRSTLTTGPNFRDHLCHGWTYSAHPIGAAAGVANLRLIDSLGLLKNADAVGTYLTASLEDALGSHPNVGEVRGVGMLSAIEFVDDKAARKHFDPARKVGPAVAAALLNLGVIDRAMPQGDILGFAPPLCLDRAEADTIVEATVGPMRSVLG